MFNKSRTDGVGFIGGLYGIENSCSKRLFLAQRRFINLTPAKLLAWERKMEGTSLTTITSSSQYSEPFFFLHLEKNL